MIFLLQCLLRGRHKSLAAIPLLGAAVTSSEVSVCVRALASRATELSFEGRMSDSAESLTAFPTVPQPTNHSHYYRHTQSLPRGFFCTTDIMRSLPTSRSLGYVDTAIKG